MKPIDQFELEPGVIVKVWPEDDPDWSWVDDDDTKRKIKRGDVEQYVIEVLVFDKSGEVSGSDILGGVVVGLDDHKQEIRDCIDANDMVKEAKHDLKNKLDKIVKGLGAQ